jgi:hypothetical protein
VDYKKSIWKAASKEWLRCWFTKLSFVLYPYRKYHKRYCRLTALVLFQFVDGNFIKLLKVWQLTNDFIPNCIGKKHLTQLSLKKIIFNSKKVQTMENIITVILEHSSLCYCRLWLFLSSNYTLIFLRVWKKFDWSKNNGFNH